MSNIKKIIPVIEKNNTHDGMYRIPVLKVVTRGDKSLQLVNSSKYFWNINDATLFLTANKHLIAKREEYIVYNQL